MTLFARGLKCGIFAPMPAGPAYAFSLINPASASRPKPLESCASASRRERGRLPEQLQWASVDIDELLRVEQRLSQTAPRVFRRRDRIELLAQFLDLWLAHLGLTFGKRR